MTEAALTVADLMSHEAATLWRNDELSIADNLMALGRIRHIPILDEDGRLAGIVSQRDLFRSALVKALGYGSVAQDRALKNIRIKEVMTNDVFTTTPHTPLNEAAALMLQHKVGCLPVLDGDKLVGILTESDFVARYAD